LFVCFNAFDEMIWIESVRVRHKKGIRENEVEQK